MLLTALQVIAGCVKSFGVNREEQQQDSIFSQAERNSLWDRDVAIPAGATRGSVDPNSWKAGKKSQVVTHPHFEKPGFIMQNNYVPGQTMEQNSANTEMPL